MRRSQSTGNVQMSLYNDSTTRLQWRSDIDKKSTETLRQASHTSVLRNAGITDEACRVTNSDKYLALKLSREFDHVLD